MAVFHRHRYPSLWSPKVVPTEQVEIDQSHPLAAGLICFYVPGSRWGLNDLNGKVSPLGFQSAAKLTATVGGAGIDCTTGVNTGAMTGGRNIILERYGNLALFSYAFHTNTLASGSGNTALVGVGNQFFASFSAYLFVQSIFSGQGAQLNCNNTQINVGSGVSTNLGLNSYVATFNNSGISAPYAIYHNGATFTASTGTTTIGQFSWRTTSPFAAFCLGSDANSSGTNSNAIMLAGGLWDTGAAQMTQSMAAWLSAEPFAMLRPVVRRTYSQVQLPGPITGTLNITQGANTLAATGTVPLAPTLTPSVILSGSRAGLGSVVLVQDDATRTAMLSNVGALTQTKQGVTPPAGGASRAIIIA